MLLNVRRFELSSIIEFDVSALKNIRDVCDKLLDAEGKAVIGQIWSEAKLGTPTWVTACDLI